MRDGLERASKPFFHTLALLGRRNYVNDGNKNGCSLLVACNVGRFFWDEARSIHRYLAFLFSF